MEQVIGKKKFCLVVDPFEEKWHGHVQGVSLGNKKHSVKLFFFGAFKLQLDDLIFVYPWQIDMLGMFKDFRNRFPLWMTKNSVGVVKVAMQFHESNTNQTVKPRVSH